MTTSQATATAAGAAQVASALPGTLFPLGATPGEHLGREGTNFALASAVAGACPG